MSKYVLQIFLIVILLSVVACSSTYQILHFDSIYYEPNNSEIVEFEKNQTGAELVNVGVGVDCTKIYELKQTLLLHQNLLLLNPEMIPVSSHFIFEQFRGHAFGDLTGNGLCDVAIVFSECYEYVHTIPSRRGTRHLFVFIANEHGELEIVGYSDSVILHQMMAGRFSDGFEHI